MNKIAKKALKSRMKTFLKNKKAVTKKAVVNQYQTAFLENK
jgi:hypothetical protein